MFPYLTDTILLDLVAYLSYSPRKKKIALFSFEVPVPWGFLFFFSYILLEISWTLNVYIFTFCSSCVLLGRISSLKYLVSFSLFFEQKVAAWNLAVLEEENTFSEDNEEPRSPKFSSPGLQLYFQRVVSAAVVSKGVVTEWCFPPSEIGAEGRATCSTEVKFFCQHRVRADGGE